MGKLSFRIHDNTVSETFELFGGEDTALYFEALRYRQQLFKRGEKFSYKTSKIQERTGLSHHKQRLAREVLAAVGWIAVERNSNGFTFLLLGDAYEATKHTQRRRNVREFYEKYARIGSFKRQLIHN